MGLGCIVRRTDVEAGVDGLPPVDALPLLQPVATAADCGWIGHKVVVEVLLARQHGAPGRRTAGTVAEGTDHAAPARVISGLQEMASGCRTGHRERRTRGHPPVSRCTADVVPRSSSARAFQLDDAEALRGHRRFEHLTLVCCRPGRRDMILRLVNSWLQQNNAKLGESRLGALVGSWICARTAALEVARHRAAVAMGVANHGQKLMHKDPRRV